MSKEDIYNVFQKYIESDYIIINQFTFVEVDDFFEFFKGVSDATSYDEYVELDDGKGYTPFFDRCKQEGILN